MTETDTDTYELAYGRLIRPESGDEFVPGEPFQPTDTELATLEYRLIPVENVDVIDAEAIVEQNVDELVPDIRDGVYDDHLDELTDAENAAESRVTVLEALDSRSDNV